MILPFIIRSEQMKHREKSQQKDCHTIGFGWFSGRDLWQETMPQSPAGPQNMTWALKCICLVALFFIPVFSSHLDFILWTYCMSRLFIRAAPVVGKEIRMKRMSVVVRENPIFVENLKLSLGFLYSKKGC